MVGERWSLLIVRDVFLGLRRFDEIQDNLGIARNVLQARLTRLVEQGVLERRPYQERPPRHEYRLTEKGLDLWPTMVALMKWGDRHASPTTGRPAARAPRLRRRGRSAPHLRTLRRAAVGRDARALPGPGASERHPLVRRREPRATRAAVST